MPLEGLGQFQPLVGIPKHILVSTGCCSLCPPHHSTGFFRVNASPRVWVGRWGGPLCATMRGRVVVPGMGAGVVGTGR